MSYPWLNPPISLPHGFLVAIEVLCMEKADSSWNPGENNTLNVAQGIHSNYKIIMPECDINQKNSVNEQILVSFLV